jgi:hypothetical protein
MPNGIDPISMQRRTNSRLAAWWRAPQLDERLARGEDPASDRALELRAERLSGLAERRRLADALESVVLSAHRGGARFSVQVAPRGQAVRECAGDLRALAGRLRDGGPVDVQGVAMVARLLSDGASPLYYKNAPRSLQHVARSARHALDPMPAVAVAA